MRRLTGVLSIVFAMSAMADESIQLRQALDSGTVTLHDLTGVGRASGEGAVVGMIENVTDSPVSLSFDFEVPIYLANLGSRQSMVSTRISLDAEVGVEIGEDGLSFTLEPGVRVKARFRSFCIDEHLDRPTSDDVFRVGETPDWLLTAVDNVRDILDISPDIDTDYARFQRQRLWEEIEILKPDEEFTESEVD